MATRNTVSVGGPKGAGKTLFIEALLRSTRRMAAVARLRTDSRRRQMQETRPDDDRELARYRAAGAETAMLLRMPSIEYGLHDTAFVWDTGLAESFADFFVVEGERPLWSADLAVYIARHVAGKALLQRRTTGGPEQYRAHLESVEELERQIEDPESLPELVEVITDSLSVPKDRITIEQINALRIPMRAWLKAYRAAGPTKEPKEWWAISPEYEGIEAAGVVIVNVDNEGEREAAERLVQDVHGLRVDRNVFDDVIGWRGTRHKITALVANLAEPSDPGLKKALSRVRRSI